MRTKSLLILTAFAVNTTACVSKKLLNSKDRIFQITSITAPPAGGGAPPVTNYTLHVLKPKTTARVVITEKENYVVLKNINPASLEDDPALPGGTRIEEPTYWKAEVGKNYFFSDETSSNPTIKRTKLVYLDTKPVLQTLTVPLKIRRAIKDPSLNDSIQSQAETSFNVGVALGWKFTRNVYRPQKSVLGLNTNRFSIAPGLFIGTGTTDLNSANTRNSRIKVAR